MFIEQELPAARLLGQLFDCVKSPVVLIPVMLSALFPVLLRVTVCVALVVPTFWPEKDNDEGETFATGASPVPLSAIECGLPAALSVKVTLPL
jgi:hypothetical protein